jgi:hypothetical protein
MLEQHFASDPDVAHEMYHDDAVLEFPQSAEHFVGVENFREWRSNYPASTKVDFRESEAEMTSGPRRSRSATTRVLGTSESASLSFATTRSPVNRSTSPRAGSHRQTRLSPLRSRSCATHGDTNTRVDVAHGTGCFVRVMSIQGRQFPWSSRSSQCPVMVSGSSPNVPLKRSFALLICHTTGPPSSFNSAS